MDLRFRVIEIRKVLDDRPDQPAFIVTFPKRGYQFVAPVSARTAALTVSINDAVDRMVGRNTGLARLAEYLQLALRGQRQVAFVTGEAGIGKTTLVDAFQNQSASDPNLRVARGQCIEDFGGIEPYYPILETIGSLIRREEDGSLIQALSQRAPTWLIQFSGPIRPEQRERLQQEIVGSTRERMMRELCETLEIIRYKCLCLSFWKICTGPILQLWT